MRRYQGYGAIANKPATLYFVRFGDTDAIKVGRTIHNVRARILALQTGSPVELRVFATCFVPTVAQAGELELLLHAALEARRIRNEWFRFDPAAIRWVTDFLDRRGLLFVLHSEQATSDVYGPPSAEGQA